MICRNVKRIKVKPTRFKFWALFNGKALFNEDQGKMVALGRALMVGQRLVLLDEPLQGLAPVLAQQYVEAIGRLRQWQPALCVVITESNAGLLSDIPDQTWLLERGALTQAAKTPVST